MKSHDESSEGPQRTVDTRSNRPPSRNGSGVRVGEGHTTKAVVLGSVGAWGPRSCPYLLGADCPLVEALQGGLRFRKRINLAFHVLAILMGVVLSVVAVRYFYYN